MTLRRNRPLRALVRFLLRYLFGREGKRLVHGLRLFYRLRVEVVLQSEQVGKITKRRSARVWVDGHEAFPRIERLLRRARHTIIIQMFIWKDDSTGQGMAAVLLEAADRGVQVHITKEVIGDVFELRQDFLGTRLSSSPLWKKFWSHPNIHVVYEKCNDHAKVYIIDDQILLFGGMNIADDYRYNWHDYFVELRGSEFVQHYLTREPPQHHRDDVRLVMNTESEKQIRPALMHLLHHAQQSIIVEHCYLSDPEVIAALIRRSHDGVRVIVIVPERPDVHYHANLQAIARLLTEGSTTMLQVFLFPGIVHGKIILVDRDTVFIGSANLMRSSIDDMGELNVLIHNPLGLEVQRLRDVLRADILSSQPLAQPPYLRWMTKVLAWMGL